MKILSVDTSATAASVALSEEGKLIGETFINTSLTHSQTLIPMVEQLLNNTKTEISDIDAIAVNAGPGSFTGVRIGVAAVKGLAFANNIPCVSVSTLESMAYNFLSTDCIVCAVMDARCSQVYNALFEIKNGVVTRLCDDRALSLDDLKNELLSVDGRIIIAGDGTDITCKYIGNEIKNADNENERDQFQWDKAQFLYNIKHYDEALSLYNDLIVKAENDRIFLLKDRLYLERAEVYKKLGQTDLAQNDIENAGGWDSETSQNPIPKPVLLLEEEQGF